MHDQIGTQLERPLHRRWRPGRVAGEQCATAVSEFREDGNVADLEKWVRGRLEPQEFCILPPRASHGVNVGRIDKADLQAPGHKNLF